MTRLVRLFLWPHRILFLGPAFEAEVHRHHGAQLCFGLRGPHRMRSAVDQPWQQAAGFFIAPDQTHEFAADASPAAILYLEAEGAEYRAYRSAAGVGDASLMPLAAPAGLEEVVQLAEHGGDCRAAARACRTLLGLPLMAAQTPGLDPRVVTALEFIKTQTVSGNPIRIAQVAAAVRLSESHLAHLFSAEMGVPLRRYVLGVRLMIAVDCAVRGASLTEAAQVGGFSDSAHLSRTHKETFGVPPSFLFEHRELMDVRFCDWDGINPGRLAR